MLKVVNLYSRQDLTETASKLATHLKIRQNFYQSEFSIPVQQIITTHSFQY